MDIKPIRSEADYEEVLAEVEQLWGSAPDTPEGGKLEVLFTLIEKYEEEHYPILPPDPIDALEYYMESRGLTRRELEVYIGSSGRVSEILSRKRKLSLKMIRNLHNELGIPADVLIQ